MKDYKNWHNTKSFIHNQKRRPYFYEKEIWFCYIGENIGFEEDGKGKNAIRPIIVFKKFNNEICLILPLSTKIKEGKYYFALHNHNKNNVAILSQIRLIDAKRLKYKIDILPENQFSELKEKLKTLLF